MQNSPVASDTPTGFSGLETRLGPADALTLAWRTSSASAGNGACVEVGTAGGGVVVRDSKDQSGPVLQFTFQEWQAFLAGVRNGEFDYGRLLET